MNTQQTAQYFTLIGRPVSEGKTAPFEIIFGDYDRECVLDEKLAYSEAGIKEYRNLKIISTADSRLAITATVARINNS